MTTTRRALALLACVAAVGVCALAVAWFPGNLAYWGTESSIEAYLRSQTPVGSTRSEVTGWLKHHGDENAFYAADIPAHSGFPLTTTGGKGFIQSGVAHYGWPFRADIEAFYTFDGEGRLVDIRVRRTVDAI